MDFRDVGNPSTTVRSLNAQGADEIILMDIEASINNREPDFDSINAIAKECFMPLTVGGGINTVNIARHCMKAGADKICLNTAALDNPGLIKELAYIFGTQAIVLAVDVTIKNNESQVFDFRTRSIADKKSPLDWIIQGISFGVGEVRLMSVEREGKKRGMDIEFVKTVRQAISVPVVFEGGAGSLEHLDEALQVDVDALAIGTMLAFSDNNLVKIKRYLFQKGHKMRLD